MHRSSLSSRSGIARRKHCTREVTAVSAVLFMLALATQSGLLEQGACAKEKSAPNTEVRGTKTITATTDNARRIRLKTGFDKRDYALSLSSADQILKDQPDDTEVLVIKGCSLTGLRRANEAEPFFRRAKELDPQNGGYRAHHVAILTVLGRVDEASRELDELTALDPNHPYGRVLVVKVAIAKGQISRAVEQANRLLGAPGIAPQDVAAELNGALDKIHFAKLPPALVEQLAQNLERLSPKTPEVTNTLAHLYLDLHRFQNVISLSQSLIKQNPKSRAYLDIANFLSSKKQDEVALLCLPKQGSIADCDEAFSFRVHALERLHQYGEALNAFFIANPDLVLRQNLSADAANCAAGVSAATNAQANLLQMENMKKTNWLHHYVYAIMLDQTGKQDAALAQYKLAYVGPGINKVVADAYSKFLIEDKKFKEAIDVLEKIPNKDEHIVSAQVRALTGLNRLDDAMALIDKYFPKSTRSATAELIAADLSRQMRKPLEAMEHYNRAVELAPQSAYARQFRMEFARAIHRYDLVCQDLDFALQQSPNNYHIYFQKGLYEQLAGKTTEADRDWKQAIRLKPR